MCGTSIPPARAADKNDRPVLQGIGIVLGAMLLAALLSCLIWKDLLGIGVTLPAPPSALERTQSRLQSLVVRVYDVRDLMSSTVLDTRPANAATLVSPITSAVDPGSWHGAETHLSVGRHLGVARIIQGQLIVTQSQLNHRQVLRALAQMRLRRNLWRFAFRAMAMVGASILIAAAGILILRSRRRRRLARAGLCKCGYDLRASRERCPECGKAIAAVALSA